MSTIDNYNTSTMGVDIELSIFRDTLRSQTDAENCFHVYSYSGTRSTFRAFYTGHGDEEAPGKVADCFDLTKVSEKEARAFVVQHVAQGGKWSPSVREVIEEKNQTYNDWCEYLEDLLYEMDLTEAIRDDFADLRQHFEIKYDVAGISGYCQGDYAEILYDPTDWSDDDAAQEHFSQLLYDSPIYARLTIDGKDFCIDEELANLYDWDREEVAKIVQGYDISDAAKAWIIENLPEHPEYI